MFNFDKLRVAIFDTETNGLTPRESVLAYSLLSADLFISDDDAFLFATDHQVRYFHRELGEAVNQNALAVHQLTEQRISDLRKEQDLDEKIPRYFSKTRENFQLWLKQDFDLIVGHNLAFDLRMVNLEPGELLFTFCTMKDARSAYKYLYPDLKGSVSLAKAAAICEIDYNTEAKHDATVDTFVTAKVFNKLITENVQIHDTIYEYARRLEQRRRERQEALDL